MIAPAPTRQPARTDLSALKFNQVTVVFVTLLAVILTVPALTFVLGAAMLVGAVIPDLSPMRAAYRLLGPALGLKPEVVEEDPRAHHFAQGVGGSFLLASASFTLAGLPLVGAVLGVTVIALAALNLSRKICVGCVMYFQYRRLRYQLLKR
ncbi:hypothetical protein GCM10008956_10050 [Deinococcus arenae]|uniref:DUF4395 domain-containing protein n=1 Tax=Deinococcus arenae TaxID=1452751 RepID=A0A8H9GLN8_9DEIO|nr:DUF4395 domain-containing protein [Deinococcus arenae]AWT35348.1 DUF4395 domain-containing protein [Deinococcus actinosclerus]GGM35573.1 hypothetical protein GCM10008956_10050 [Deinococcus arenae]